MMTIRGQTRLFTKRRKRLGRLRYFATFLSAVIVFCTVYALILPAITMERTAFCGLEVHEHTDACFDSGGELICSLVEHQHNEECYLAPGETLPPTESVEKTTVEAPTEAPTQAETEEPIVVVKRSAQLAPTGESTADAVIYKKQIEKLGGDDDYTYRLHLTVDGTNLEGSTTTTEEGDSTGIVLLIDVTKDFTATTTDNKSKLEVIQGIVNNYINQFSVSQRNKISVILVKGEQSGSINSNGTVEVKKGWDGYETISIGNQQIRYTANFKAGLVEAGQYIKSADTDKTAVVFITNSNPQWSVTDTGAVDRTVTNESEAKTATMNYLPTFFNNYPETDLYILDVEQASEKHETPQAMGEYIESVDRGKYFTAGSSTELIDSFDDIITTIIPGDKTTNLSVSDTLSANVEYVGNPTATLTLGSTSSDVTNDLVISGSTVSYSHADEIEGAYKFEIAFDIKTKDGLYFDPDVGYPNTGDSDTDYGSNTTSSNQPGYFSNSSAGLGFTLNGTPFTGTFKHPVVQAPDKPQPKTQTVKVTKHWADSLSPSPVQLKLYEENGGTYTEIAQLDLSGEQDASDSYTYTFPDGETSKELYLVESDIGTLPLYSGETVAINLGTGETQAQKLTLTPDGEELEVTVTNWPKTSMPATGGTGTYPLMIGGALLVLIALGMLIYKKKQNS
ncbi:MAG: LPXTG cell wall anchor domain-containing protein [Ruminococcus sp.]|nr:LPXTG cell wall anchor domain-containing protein [Ruminococcus sp.]